MKNERDAILKNRLLSHRILSKEKFKTVEETIKSSLCMQSQDEAMTLYSIHLRTGLDKGEIIRQLNENIVRTHILRPTWHYVAKDDIRWLIELTGKKIISSNKSYQNKLGINEDIITESEKVVKQALINQGLTKQELSDILPKTDFDKRGLVLSHLLMILEAKGIICSTAGMERKKSEYILIDNIAKPLDVFDRKELVEKLVFRFLKGHGTASVKDVLSWCNIAKKETIEALNKISDGRFEYEGVDHWFLRMQQENINELNALVPRFDELILTHKDINFPRLDDYSQTFSFEQGGGTIIIDNIDVGVFKRKNIKKNLLHFEVFTPSSFSDFDKLDDLLTRYSNFMGQEEFSLDKKILNEELCK